jgi:hypothetical protein
MSKKHDFQLRKWQYLIEECQKSGMKILDWCAANDISKHQYYYWLAKIRLECYEKAVSQLQTTKTSSNVAVPVQVQNSSFVEISPEMVSVVPKQGNLSQPVAIVQKGSIRVEIMSNAPASFIRQLLEAVRYA